MAIIKDGRQKLSSKNLSLLEVGPHAQKTLAKVYTYWEKRLADNSEEEQEKTASNRVLVRHNEDSVEILDPETPATNLPLLADTSTVLSASFADRTTVSGKGSGSE